MENRCRIGLSVLCSGKGLSSGPKGRFTVRCGPSGNQDFFSLSPRSCVYLWEATRLVLSPLSATMISQDAAGGPRGPPLSCQRSFPVAVLWLILRRIHHFVSVSRELEKWVPIVSTLSPWSVHAFRVLPEVSVAQTKRQQLKLNKAFLSTFYVLHLSLLWG